MWSCLLPPQPDSVILRIANSRRDPKKPCVYVGMTGLDLEERLANHEQGIKDAPVVKRYGLRLLPELYAHLNPRNRCLDALPEHPG